MPLRQSHWNPGQEQAKKTAQLASATQDAPTDLAPNQRGLWNAAGANQAALDAHIRNQNFNGTIGALAQFQLAAKAASGTELSPEEEAALDGFVGEAPEVTYSDEELAAALNGDGLESAPVFDDVARDLGVERPRFASPDPLDPSEPPFANPDVPLEEDLIDR